MLNVTLVGCGYVGSSLALLLLNNNHSIRLNIMEPNENFEGTFLDLSHGMSLYHQKELHRNDAQLLLEADFVFYTAGTPNIHGESRLSTAKSNIELTRSIFEKKLFLNNPYIIVITNPVDIVSHAVYQFSNLPSDRVIGTGTFLDSIRLSYYLSQVSGQKPTDFESYVLGEHGDSQVPIYSNTKWKGEPIFDYSEFPQQTLDLAGKMTRDAAFKIRETQIGTTYGISKCAEILMNYLVNKEKHLIPLSMLTNKHYRNLLNLNQDIYISLPAEISKGKVVINNKMEFSPNELAAFRKSAAIIAENTLK
jgi:L-lactate dehydrogenase